MTAAWLGGSYLPSGGFLYPERSYHIDQARYYSTDPRRTSVSAYAGAPDPLVRPDYTGAAPDKPGVSTATALDAAVDHHAEASGENLAQLATTSEASLEGSSRTGSTVAASPVTVSTRQNPSPFAQRYLSDNSVRSDPDGALAVKCLIWNCSRNFQISDDFLRGWIGRDPIESDLMKRSFSNPKEKYVLRSTSESSDSSDGDQDPRRKRLIPRKSVPKDHQPLVVRKYAFVPPMPAIENETEMETRL